MISGPIYESTFAFATVSKNPNRLVWIRRGEHQLDLQPTSTVDGWEILRHLVYALSVDHPIIYSSS